MQQFGASSASSSQRPGFNTSATSTINHNGSAQHSPDQVGLALKLLENFSAFNTAGGKTRELLVLILTVTREIGSVSPIHPASSQPGVTANQRPQAPATDVHPQGLGPWAYIYCCMLHCSAQNSILLRQVTHPT
jgi:hypothetical protein